MFHFDIQLYCSATTDRLAAVKCASFWRSATIMLDADCKVSGNETSEQLRDSEEAVAKFRKEHGLASAVRRSRSMTNNLRI
jgi:hypothetical protein